jgi:hypothetical protein
VLAPAPTPASAAYGSLLDERTARLGQPLPETAAPGTTAGVGMDLSKLSLQQEQQQGERTPPGRPRY